MPLTYLIIYTSDTPRVVNRTIVTYADDTVILVSDTASSALQIQLDLISTWAIQWQIKIDSDKSFHVVFTTRKKDSSSLEIQGVDIPTTSQAKYLEIILDKRQTCGLT